LPTLLLPERRRFSGQPVSASVLKLLGRADVEAGAEAGERAQLQRYFQLRPDAWPMAAMTRQLELGDAQGHRWLRADPVHVRPDMTGARMLAWGNLGVDETEAEQFLQALRPLFGDAGMPLTRTHPERWYLQLAREAKLPEFAPPEVALGGDLLQLLPSGPEGARWRALLNEAQVILHNHPANARRQARGAVSANSLWFWGAGLLPEAVRSSAVAVRSADAELQALARLAGIDADAAAGPGMELLDLRQERDWRRVEREYIEAWAGQGATAGELWLDFADGARFRLDRGQRWRFWRAPARGLGG
jgi:hypothetical protein